MTATYTTPRTWATGEIVTAAIMNEHVRDNFDYLKARPVVTVNDFDGTVANTSSTSFVDLTGATVDITTSGSSKLLITAHVIGVESSAAAAYITAKVDGTNQGHATNGLAYKTVGTNSDLLSFVFLTAAAVADGAHTVKLQYRTSANTLTVQAFGLVVREVF